MSAKDLTVQLWVPWMDAYTISTVDPRYELKIFGIPWHIKADIPFGIERALVDAGYDDRLAVANKLITTHLLVAVAPKDVPSITNAVAYNSLPLKTRMLVEMFAACRADWNSTAEAHFAAIPSLSLGNAALKTIAKELLEQARPRGLSAAKAEAIRSQYNLPTLTATIA